MKVTKENYQTAKFRQVRVSNTAKERLFTVGMHDKIFRMLGDHGAKVTVVATLTKGVGIKVKVKADKKGTQLLRFINHNEVGLRINSKQGNPVDFPFKSVHLIADMNEEERSIEFSIPLASMKEAKPRQYVRDFGLFPEEPETREIPISAAKRIAEEYGYDQVIIIGRKVSIEGIEHITTYGVNKAHCDSAAKQGNKIKELYGWNK